VIKNLATLLIFGLVYSSHAAAQELGSGDMGGSEGAVPIAVPAAELARGFPGSPFYSSFYPPALIDQHVSAEARRHAPRHTHSFGQPVIVLPMEPYINTTSGFQYPGSYTPRGTPLHRSNGYIVCDPPKLTGETTTETAAGTTSRRLVKITSTRSLSTEGYPGPCPVYTINGELPQQKSRATTTMPSTRNAPSK
jgi:hypothetical protein